MDESKLQRTAYARLVRKGEGSRDSALSLEAEVRVRTALMNDAGVCPGVGVGLAIALRSITLVPRVAWCQSGYTNEGLHATTNEWDLELQGSYVWDVGPVSIRARAHRGRDASSTSRSAPPGPRRRAPPPRSSSRPSSG